MICRIYRGPRGPGLIFGQSHNHVEAVKQALDTGTPRLMEEHGHRFVSVSEDGETFKAGVIHAVTGCDAPEMQGE
jgi:CTP:molybdopterin cytidylyltransferase MocA